MKKACLLLSTAFLTLFIDPNAIAQTGWAWMKGNNGSNGNAVFGSLGVPNPANTPPSLYEPAEWKDLQGNFWFFGGMLSTTSPVSALWKFDPINNEWTWMGG